MRRDPVGVQTEQLQRLIHNGSHTSFGREHGLESVARGVDACERFRERVPVREYGELAPWIERARRGEKDVLWPGHTPWFAKSSGTTGAKSKYIPVTRDGLKDSHLQGPRDCLVFNSGVFPDTAILGGKTLTLGGSRRLDSEGNSSGVLSGDLSAIMIENTPWFAGPWRTPPREIALEADFERKVEMICKCCAGQDVRALAGVPSWNLVMLRRVLEYTGKNNLLEVWPRLELFMHGGVNFEPYRRIYSELIPSEGMHYLETYNASEGFFAIADDFSQDGDMLLMLDYGIFYEFLPTTQLGDYSKVVGLQRVELGVNYAMIISTSSGLWRYMIGDVVQFTSLSPFRIRIAGRTRHYINAFGEELIVDNAERAIVAACEATGALVGEYTAAPVYMDLRRKGAHQWVVEFAREPSSMEEFTAALDRALMAENSDYEAKRFRDTTLLAPVVTVVPSGTFRRWMEARGKVGGQNKVPRLANSREFVDQILEND